jgi:hypothetical protein
MARGSSFRTRLPVEMSYTFMIKLSLKAFTRQVRLSSAATLPAVLSVEVQGDFSTVPTRTLIIGYFSGVILTDPAGTAAPAPRPPSSA